MKLAVKQKVGYRNSKWKKAGLCNTPTCLLVDQRLFGIANYWPANPQQAA